MRPMFTVDPVVCSRGKTFDAEVSFKEEEYSRESTKVKYNQRLIQAGFDTRESAQAKAEEICKELEALIRNASAAYLNQYKEAKP